MLGYFLNQWWAVFMKVTENISYFCFIYITDILWGSCLKLKIKSSSRGDQQVDGLIFYRLEIPKVGELKKIVGVDCHLLADRKSLLWKRQEVCRERCIGRKYVEKSWYITDPLFGESTCMMDSPHRESVIYISDICFVYLNYELSMM